MSNSMIQMQELIAKSLRDFKEGSIVNGRNIGIAAGAVAGGVAGNKLGGKNKVLGTAAEELAKSRG